MESTNTEVAHEFFPYFKVYKDGRVERFHPIQKVPPSEDPITGVRSKDVTISPETGVSVRIFIPKSTDPNHKLPLVFYIHGGAFSIESAFSPNYHNYVNSLVAEANIVAVSVEYRLAPENPIPACYDDSWAALQWVASHANGNGPESWLNTHADLRCVYIAGDSAGANISHNMAVRVGSTGLPDTKMVGLVLIHPYFHYFGNKDYGKNWLYMCGSDGGVQDPMPSPCAENLERIGCGRVLVCVAEKDILRDRGTSYYEELKKSGWEGTVEIMEAEGEGHVFHLFNPNCDKAVALMKRIVSFINHV